MSIEKEKVHTTSSGDPGFGAHIIQQSKQRLLNQDGTFNVRRKGLPLLQSLNLYNTLLNITWLQFYISLIAIYILVITLFALAFYLVGPDALTKPDGLASDDFFLLSFFFSVHTITTVGYGHIAPNGMLANILVTIEAFVGLGGFAIAAALIFARFSRPKANVLFSQHALIGSYHDLTCFMFRIANGASSELVEVEARILLSLKHTVKGVRTRRFYELELEKNKRAFFPVDWIVVHPITRESPLHNLSQQELGLKEAEFLVLINAIDDTFAQDVHARSSYRWEEVIWGARFKDMYREMTRDGIITIDVNRLDEFEHIDTPLKSSQTIWDF